MTRPKSYPGLGKQPAVLLGALVGLVVHGPSGLAAAQQAAESPPTVETTAGPSGATHSDSTPVATNPTQPGPAPASTSPLPAGGIPSGPVAPAFPPAVPNIDYGGRMRIGLRLSDTPSAKLRDPSATVEADLYMIGQLHRMLKWQIAATVSYGGTPGTASTVAFNLLDAIARFELMPELNVYVGRMLVTADRFNQGGPWGMDEWFYAGLLPGAPGATPKSGPVGRDVGVNVWGAALGGYLKYYLGAYQLQDPDLNPLLSGRIQMNFLSPEPAFYHRTTYYGTKDVISAGIGAQYQKEGSRQPAPAMPDPAFVAQTDDHDMLTADLVIEQRIGGAGTMSVNGAAYLFRGDYRAWESLYLGSLGFLFPRTIGIGKLRPSIRVQLAQAAADGAQLSHVVDAQLSYVIMGWFARLHLTYRRSSIDLGKGPVAGDMLVLGVVLADP